MSKPPSLNEIRAAARAFATRWEGTTEENAEAQTFWNEFLAIFNIDRKRVATFEARATRTSTGGRGRIDLLWPGTLAAEHKSAGKDLAAAEEQALDYLESIGEDDFPGVVITSDFTSIRVRDLSGDNNPYTFRLENLPLEIDRFAFIAGYQQRSFGTEAEVEANIAAARLMARLYEELAANGYEGHEASILLTRLLFLMFGDDTGMWERDLFSEFLESRTSEDGSDLGPQLAFLFQLLDRPEERRPDKSDELLLRFPYVNGGLFADRLDIPTFDRKMRDELINCCRFDWGAISPAVFGSLFQAVKSKEARRDLGEHYTTEANILRLLGPMFLDDLQLEFEASKSSRQKLERLHDRLASITVLDPACGCGNFLIIAYRELRRLELDILVRLAELKNEGGQMKWDATLDVRVRLDNFYGIEIEEWPARIAETGMFLVDQQANHELARIFGQAPDRLPIDVAAHIHVGNAIRTDWTELLPPAECTYIVGNPPFIGMSLMSKEQRDDNQVAFANIGGKRTGRLDYVACWYAKALEYMQGSEVRAAFVSTSSLVQGEQAREMGPLLASFGCNIDFAHRTFAWSSEAPGAAAVHVVVIGFSAAEVDVAKRLFDYQDLKGEPHELSARHINIYLADSDVPSIRKHTTPLVPNPKLTEGNRPQDGGGLIVTRADRAEIEADPVAHRYMRRLIGAHDMLQGDERWCLWMPDASPADLRRSAALVDRLAVVAEARRNSPTEAARAKANTPSTFFAIRQPKSRWLCVPRHSSENRRLIPMAFFQPDDIAHDSTLTLDGADEYLFGILQSAMFTVWVKTVSGRIKSDIRVSPDLSYNSFPFPNVPSSTAKSRVEQAALAVLETRADHAESSLADLYDPLVTPPDLVKAHDVLDSAVDALYGRRRLNSSAERLALLFSRYSELVGEAEKVE